MSRVPLYSNAEVLKLKHIYYTSLSCRIKEVRTGELHDESIMGSILGWIQTYLEHCFVIAETPHRCLSTLPQNSSIIDQNIDQEMEQARILEEEVQRLENDVDSVRQQALASTQQYSLSYLQHKHKLLDCAAVTIENETTKINMVLSPEPDVLTHSLACAVSKMPPLRARLQENLERLECVLSAVKADHAQLAAQSPTTQHRRSFTPAISPGPRQFSTISKRRKLARELREASCRT